MSAADSPLTEYEKTVVGALGLDLATIHDLTSFFGIPETSSIISRLTTLNAYLSLRCSMSSTVNTMIEQKLARADMLTTFRQAQKSDDDDVPAACSKTLF